MGARKREYTIYATSRGGDFTTYSVNYSKGTHPWVYKVYAVSIKQAYALAASETFAKDAHSVGVREMEIDWWHRGESEETAEAKGLRMVAPYLKDESADG